MYKNIKNEINFIGRIIKVKRSRPVKNRLNSNKPIWSDDQWHSQNLKEDTSKKG